jgi:hypothetical protein
MGCALSAPVIIGLLRYWGSDIVEQNLLFALIAAGLTVSIQLGVTPFYAQARVDGILSPFLTGQAIGMVVGLPLAIVLGISLGVAGAAWGIAVQTLVAATVTVLGVTLWRRPRRMSRSRPY